MVSPPGSERMPEPDREAGPGAGLLGAGLLGAWLESAGVPGRRTSYLYRQALSHKSFKNGLDSNERLEFLGDSILGGIITEYIMKRYPDHSEGFLSSLRSQLVRGSTLTHIARRLRLETVLAVDAAQQVSDSMLEDAFEALVGAVFLVVGYNRTRNWLVGLYEKLVDFAAIIKDGITPRDRLLARLNGQGRGLRSEVAPAIDGVRVVLRTDLHNVIGVGEAACKKQAFERAYAGALRYLGRERPAARDMRQRSLGT